jgi:hypothetical protein
MFVQIGSHSVVHTDEINWIDIRKIEDLVIVVHHSDHQQAIISGIQAIDLLMTIKPSVLESRRLRWYRHAWAIHNLVGHPLMQVLAFLKQYKLAMRVHDMTVPRPLGRRLYGTSENQRAN